MSGQQVGYTRVSSLDQNPDRQLDGVALDRTFTDSASGRSTGSRRSSTRRTTSECSAAPNISELISKARDANDWLLHAQRVGQGCVLASPLHRTGSIGTTIPVSYTHLTLPTKR